jgi:ATP-dependent exoDNAse (exonuclease V) beta subunit
MTKTFISAGAGSGKTYRITTDVAQLVYDKKLNPDQVIMTTFTKAAAQELREKAKKELANIGLHHEAQQMEHALIGTVHSVANTFLTKYWYLLGIMPDATAMEEEELQLYRDHSLRGLLESKDRAFLYHFAETYEINYGFGERKVGLNYEFWKKDLCTVLDYIQWYGIDDKQLEKSIETTESIIGSLSSCKIEELRMLLNDFYQEVEEFFGLKKTLTEKQQKAKDFYLSLHNCQVITPDDVDLFNDHFKLKISSQKIDYYLKDKPASQKVAAYIQGFKFLTEQTANDQRKYAKFIFSLATRWQKEYRQYKDEHHLIDFNDMETMFLKLLKVPEVQQDIKSRYTHLFVDEFQDSNPMQVRIFQQLSSLLNTIYVGDKKQAIYGFRGADTDLTTAVANSFCDKDKENLKHSYRSVELLVNFSNAIFSQVFNQMKADEVILNMPPKNGNQNQVEHPLRLWPKTDDADLALQIQQLIIREDIDAKDIAVLAYSNAELDKLAEELRKLHVPVCREATDIKDSRTGRLLKALLTLVNTPSNQLARAEVAYLTEPNYHVTQIIEHRLDHLAAKKPLNTYLEELSVLQRLAQLQQFRSNAEQEYGTNLLGHQSISSLVESLVIELDLYALVQSWENAKAEETNLQVFIDLARKYEDTSTKVAKPATILGFINYFTNQQQKGAANEEGVHLFTYHKSKGLEWKVVIMLSLDKDYADATEIATKYMLGCHWHREQKPTLDNSNPPMTISLIRNIYGNSDAAKAAVTSRLQQHPLWKTVAEHEISEAARLLYVGVTRARNILILAPKEKDGGISLSWFRSVGVENISQVLGNEEEKDIFELQMSFHIEHLDKDNLIEWDVKKPSKVHDIAKNYSSHNQLLYLSPSKAGKTLHDIKVINDKEYRMIVDSKDHDALMGDFIHQVFCCCDDGINAEQITQLRDSYGFTEKNMPEPAKLLDSWAYLTKVLESRYGKAVKRHHERPFRHVDSNGHIVSGYIDLIWETEDAYVVVDYKTCPGNYSLVFDPTKEHFAGHHGDQLDCYQRALEADGKKKVAARIIYYPVTRFVVEVQ